jgi:outer membrane protein assembly factor BamB
VAGNARGEVSLIRAQDGRRAWQQALGSPLRARPALDRDRLFVSLDDGRVMAVTLATGDKVWERKLGGPPGDLVVSDDRIYAGSLDNNFYCLALSDGRVKWRWLTGGDIVGRPVVDRARTYFLSLDNLLRALDRRSGVQRWKAPLPNRSLYGPLVFADMFLASGIAPILNAFRIRDGLACGSHTIAVDANLVGPPHIQEGLIEIDVTLFFVTGDGELLGLRPAAALVPPLALPTPPAPPGVPLAPPAVVD